jgi:hypothetical protein
MLFVRKVLLLLVDAPLGAGREVKTRWFCVTSDLPLSLTRAVEGCPTNVCILAPNTPQSELPSASLSFGPR